MLQVVQLDRWDDPHAGDRGVPAAKAEEPDLQLVLAGLLDPAQREDWQAAKEVVRLRGRTRTDVLLLTSYEGLGSLELGALQRLARAVLELSLREGFDLAPCEALWKRTPVVGRAEAACRCTSATAWTASWPPSPRQLAGRLVELVRDPGLAAEMGRAGRERVRERFLVTAALERELRAAAPSSVRAAMKVTLPDGTPLELPDGATGADAAARDRRGPRARGARRSRVNGDLRDLDGAARRRRRIEIVTAKRRRRASG